jgi:hypothetical protein
MEQRNDSKSNGPPRTKRRRPWNAALSILILLAAVYLVVSWGIGAGVRSIGDVALKVYPGDRVSALMALVESEEQSFRNRNRAIWALGQLGDPRALPVLERHYTGGPSDERIALSQYELKKAIALCRGAVNISALVWRHGSLAPQRREPLEQAHDAGA